MEQHEYHSGDHVKTLLTDHLYVVIAVFCHDLQSIVSIYFLL